MVRGALGCWIKFRIPIKCELQSPQSWDSLLCKEGENANKQFFGISQMLHGIVCVLHFYLHFI